MQSIHKLYIFCTERKLMMQSFKENLMSKIYCFILDL
jgi:hypothetical protein